MIQLVNLLDSESLEDVTGYTKTEHLTWTDEPYRIDFASRGEIEHASTWEGPNFDYYFNKLLNSSLNTFLMDSCRFILYKYMENKKGNQF